MQIRKPLAVAGILVATLFTGTALTGGAYADSSPGPTASKIDADAHRLPATEKTPVAEKKQDTLSRKPSASWIDVTVPREKVRQGDTYTVTVRCGGLKDGATVQVTGIDGRRHTLTVKNGEAIGTFKVARDLGPGPHKVSVTAGGLADDADVLVVKA
ncbi:hypothetical protein [Sphaerisporangium fuscum]|uniref:hypothetical protein n=1 Tax=Sphaerisporangium fuscum TaxID=2835868 RepID=UPI001BDC31B8|nr:hypothetical protein [Sphaerisporangium fuscum]